MNGAGLNLRTQSSSHTYNTLMPKSNTPQSPGLESSTDACSHPAGKPESQLSLWQIWYSCTMSGILLPIHEHLKGRTLKEFTVKWGWGGVRRAILGQNRQIRVESMCFRSVKEGQWGWLSGLETPWEIPPSAPPLRSCESFSYLLKFQPELSGL